MNLILRAVTGLSLATALVSLPVWADSIDTMRKLQAQTGQLNQEARDNMQQWQQDDSASTSQASQPAPDSRQAWQQAGDGSAVRQGQNKNVNRRQWQRSGVTSGPQPQQVAPRVPRGTRTMPNAYQRPRQ